MNNKNEAISQKILLLERNRQIRIQLDALRPIKASKKTDPRPGTRHLQVGERVQARSIVQNKPVWKFGTIIRKLGQLHYYIKLDQGPQIKCHIDQIRSTRVQKKVSFNLTPVAQPIPTAVPHIPRPPPPAPVIDEDNRAPEGREPPQQPAEPTIRRSGRDRRPPAYLKDYIQ